MGSRDRPHKEAKKKPKAKSAQPSLSPLSEPPQNVEVIRKPRKERTVVEDDTEQALAGAYDSFLDQFETSEGGSIKVGHEPQAEALEDEDVEQEQIVKQKRS